MDVVEEPVYSCSCPHDDHFSRHCVPDQVGTRDLLAIEKSLMMGADVNCMTRYTALHAMITDGNDSVKGTELLLRHKANPWLPNAGGWRPSECWTVIHDRPLLDMLQNAELVWVERIQDAHEVLGDETNIH